MNFRIAFAATLGSALEFYDFIIYGFFAHVLSTQFASVHSQNTLNEITFASLIFALGCIARPFGALLFGHIGDTQGRLKSLYYSMLLSGFSCILIVVTPNYAYIGLYSTIIFFIARICQSISFGGSLGSSIAYLSEMTTMRNRGIWISTIFMGINRGLILASAISSILLLILTKNQLNQWGWRIAFLVGLPIILTALYTKRILSESPLYKASRVKYPDTVPIKLFFKEYKLDLLFGIGLYSPLCISTTCFFFYLPTFLSHYKIPSIEIISINACGLIVFSFMIPLFAWIGDIYGQRKILLLNSVFVILTSQLCYNLLISGELGLMCVGSMILGCTTAMTTVTIPVIMAGQFPTRVRLTGLGMTHTTSYAVISLSTIFVIQLLSRHLISENKAIPILMIASSCISMLCSTYFKPEDDFLVIRELRESQNGN